MFNILSPQIILTYLIAGCMVAVGGGSLLARWAIGLAASIGIQIDPHLADSMLPSESAALMFWAGLALFGYRRTQQRQLDQQERIANLLNK